MNILVEADKIVNHRSEEAGRNYGDFSKSMEDAASIFNAMTGNSISPQDMYKAMIALKLSREKHVHKEDNLLDAVAYLAGLNNYENEKKPTNGRQQAQ